MTQKFSPSVFHHGNVHGCLSARPDLLIQKDLLEHKALYRSIGAALSEEKTSRSGHKNAQKTRIFVLFCGHLTAAAAAILGSHLCISTNKNVWRAVIASPSARWGRLRSILQRTVHSSMPMSASNATRVFGA